MLSNERSYVGGEITDSEIVEKLPQIYRDLLQQVNGCILFNGGLHIRGAVVSPSWHSLQVAWFGETALHRLFPAIKQQDIPFGQDCFGDQFVLRDGAVHRLQAETGDIENLAFYLRRFFCAPKMLRWNFYRSNHCGASVAKARKRAPSLPSS